MLTAALILAAADVYLRPGIKSNQNTALCYNLMMKIFFRKVSSVNVAGAMWAHIAMSAMRAIRLRV